MMSDSATLTLPLEKGKLKDRTLQRREYLLGDFLGG
jgi:hypothetical protein